MQQVQRGFRSKLEDFINVNSGIIVDLSIEGSSVCDFSCFGVDVNNKLSDDRYMIFYNQTASPNNEINVNLMQGRAVFNVNLSALPQNIDKLVFTASIDGQGNMSEIVRHLINVAQNNQIIFSSEIPGSQFFSEKAIISLEIYRKGVWRINFVGQGFNGGLSDLLSFYGGQEAVSQQSAPVQAPQSVPQAQPAAYASWNQPAASAPASAFAPTMPLNGNAVPDVKVSLEKKLEAAPKLVSLAKHVAVSLKKNNLENIVARVGLVIDASGSMNNSYADGTVQEIVNRILPLAVQFDDDGELDTWFFADAPMRFPSVNLSNYETIVPIVNNRNSSYGNYGSGGGSFADRLFGSNNKAKTSCIPGQGMTLSSLHQRIGYCNDEVAVMRQVIQEYRESRIPAYVVFISDGGVHETEGIIKAMIEASRYPIFWQFVGVRGSNYGILEHLDTMEGRFIDNANFFSLDDFMSVDKTELYNRLLGEFPSWLKEAKAKGIY